MTTLDFFPKEKRIGFADDIDRENGKEEWLTPPEIIHAVGPFDLDPCAPVNRPWPTAKKHFTIQDNGLVKPWEGLVWCNPPYGPKTGDWLGCWGNFDIIPCRDGKARRIESGVFPLAHGVSGRVGLLRGYGNAIVPWLAAEFIRAYCEVK